VLNHFGARDVWSGLSGHIIYDAGPSGRHGFAAVDRNGAPQAALARCEPDFGHSTVFKRDSIRRAYAECWRTFLTAPAAELSNTASTTQAPSWKPPPEAVRFFTAMVALCLAASIAGFAALALIVGLIQIFA
jgi:hypothetical protein